MLARTLIPLFTCFALISLPAVGQQQNTSGQASIEGKTTSAGGQPLRKTNLTLRPVNVGPLGGIGGGGAAGQFQPPTPYAATSDAEGKFSFTGLEPGRYTLQAERTGYLNTQYGTRRTAGGIQSTGNPLINLTAGQHMTGINVELSPQATISGKVTDEDGDPMPRLQVSALRRMYTGGSSQLRPFASTSTDENGDFHLPNLQTGRYYVSVSPPRMGPMQQGARRTGADALAPETGYGTLYFPGAADVETAAPVDVVEGQDKGGTNLRMRKVPVYHVRGSVGGDLPTPDPSMPAFAAGRLVQVSVTPAAGGIFGGLNMQTLNPDGSFDAGGLTPGVYTVSLLRAQGQIQVLGQTTVTIGNRDVTDIKLIGRSAVEIAGTARIVPEGATVATGGGPTVLGGPQQARSSGGQQPRRARLQQVSLQPVDGTSIGANVQPAQVQDNGSFTFKNVPPLKFRIVAQPPPGGFLKSGTLNGQDALEDGADMSAGGKIEIVVSMTAAQIDGTVSSADGQAVADATIAIVPDPARPGRRDLYRQARSRADGGYTAPALAPGKYRVYAFEELEPGAFLDPDYMKPFESLGTTITVEENDKKTVALTQISKEKAQDALRRAGR